MSYLSRLYNHRNAQAPEGKEKKPFFSKKKEDKTANNGKFFQPKGGADMASVQRLATSLEDEKLGTNDARMERDKEDKVKAVQKSGIEKEKDKNVQIQKKDMKEDDKLKGIQKTSAEQEKKKIQKMELPERKREEGLPPHIQKMTADHEKENLQKKGVPQIDEEKKKKSSTVQTKHNASANTVSPQVTANLKKSAGNGQSLPKKTIREMNSSFGTDFSNVKIHNDSEAVNMNKDLHAHAFTHGNDIYFSSGKYDPESTEGKHLLVHELTHVVQQNSDKISKSDDADNGCRKISIVPCPGFANNFTRLGYVGSMTLRNAGSCVLFVHSLDANGNNLEPTSSFSIQPGETKNYTAMSNATDTAVVCENSCNGNGIIEHPYYCA